MKTIKEVCKSCKGTGLYSGMGEGKGAAVVCGKCDGTGCVEHEYEEFVSRKERRDVKRVYQTNPGVGIGEGKSAEGVEFTLEDFGGMPYKEWIQGLPFPKGSEMRKYTCPSWFYQGVDHTKKPEWDKCKSVGYFSACKFFYDKDKCWERWDKEFGK